MKKGDFAIIAVVLLLAGAIFAAFAAVPAQSLTCQITQDGKLVREIRLGAGYHDTITIDGAVHNEITIDGKVVYFSESDCPDQVCVRTGKLTKAGQMAVCLPNKVIVRLVSADGQQEVDAIVK